MSITANGSLLDRDQWLSRRRSVVGASELAIVLGLKPSILELYWRKTSEMPDEGPREAMAWGIRLEDDIAEAYCERTGRTIEHTQRFGVHPNHPFMGATLDAITSCRRVVEFKSVGPHGHGAKLGADGESDTLPDEWVCQVTQQLAVAGALGWTDGDEADIAVFGPGLQLRIYPVRWNGALYTMASDAIHRFMSENVLAGMPPEEIVSSDADILAKVFRGDTGEILQLGAEVEEHARAYLELAESIRDLEGHRKLHKAHLLHMLGDAAGAEFPGGWSVSRKSITVNHKAREAHTSEQIRLTIKEPRS